MAPPKANTAVEKDPLSIISIFARRQGQVPAQSHPQNLYKVDGSVRIASEKKRHSRERQSSARQQKSKQAKGVTSATDSIIDEEYSQDFSESKSKHSDSIIEEEQRTPL